MHSTHVQPDFVVRAGGWLFRHRSWLPVPVALALVLVPKSSTSVAVLLSGLALTFAGELLRLAAVRQIGTISRTRSDRLGPLVAAGPFRWVRNPLYLGNFALWLGFTLTAQLPWLALPVAVLLGLEYHAIVRWEEQLLLERLGDSYRAYVARVPRWLPRPGRSPGGTPAVFSWRETFFSERGTLLAIGAGFLVLWVKDFLA